MTDTPAAPGWNLEHSYAALPQVLFAPLAPVPVRAPRMVVLNRPMCHSLGLAPNALEGQAGARLLSGNELPPGANPLAQAYAGHQFGHFTMLGDGRAILLGEQVAPDGRRFDIQFKGSGPTPFSRGGDGRAALGPMLREYIISEAMHALGIPTSRSLAVVATGEPVQRERPLDGAVLTRVSSGHVRFGTFQYLAAREDEDALRALAEYVIARHFPALTGREDAHAGLLEAAISSHARLVAAWMGVGFVHGVMNTDNMFLSGETMDYGPCAFMDRYDPGTVFSSIDGQGRYAYGNQPAMLQWNLARFAEALLGLMDPDRDRAVERAREILGRFPDLFSAEWLKVMRAKLGLSEELDTDAELVRELLEAMHEAGADYTNTFRALSEGWTPEAPLAGSERFLAWNENWKLRLAHEPDGPDGATARMLAANPAYIPRNVRVEEALMAAVEEDDLSVMHRLLEVLASPYERREGLARYAEPPAPEAPPYRTFCGT